MRQIRIDRDRALKVAAMAGMALLGVSVLPGLLRSPEPPEVPPDVGFLPADRALQQSAGEAGRIRARPEVDPHAIARERGRERGGGRNHRENRSRDHGGRNDRPRGRRAGIGLQSAAEGGNPGAGQRSGGPGPAAIPGTDPANPAPPPPQPAASTPMTEAPSVPTAEPAPAPAPASQSAGSGGRPGSSSGAGSGRGSGSGSGPGPGAGDPGGQAGSDQRAGSDGSQEFAPRRLEAPGALRGDPGPDGSPLGSPLSRLLPGCP